MSFKERLERYRTKAQSRNIPNALIGPLPYQVLWAIGVPVTPPFHQSFVGRLFTIGIPTGLAFGIGMAIVTPTSERPSVLMSVGQGAGFGAMFGAFWAILTLVLRSRYKVPPWDTAG